MQRHQLEHIIRAASGITGVADLVIVGSQAVLGQFPEAPPELLVSIEADVFALRDPKAGDLIDGSIGEGSPFHETFGYYAHGVAADTAVLPNGWQGRLIPIRNPNTSPGTGLCLEVHDLAVSKLVAGREKDIEFVAAMLRNGLVNRDTVRERLQDTTLEPEFRTLCQARWTRLATN